MNFFQYELRLLIPGDSSGSYNGKVALIGYLAEAKRHRCGRSCRVVVVVVVVAVAVAVVVVVVVVEFHFHYCEDFCPAVLGS